MTALKIADLQRDAYEEGISLGRELPPILRHQLTKKARKPRLKTQVFWLYEFTAFSFKRLSVRRGGGQEVR